jgi:tripartite-type tricarboxylate transporter receptor subunit TctC
MTTCVAFAVITVVDGASGKLSRISAFCVAIAVTASMPTKTGAPPDAVTAALAINVALNPKLGYHPLKDFTLITALAAVPTVLVAPPSLPASNLQEFVALARSRPGQLAYGSAGNGSVHHLTMAVFASRAKVDMLHVPYKGGTALVAAVLTGEVQSGWSGILQEAVAKALREPDVAARMANLAMELRENGTEHYVRFVKEDLDRYAAAVKTAGVNHE